MASKKRTSRSPSRDAAHAAPAIEKRSFAVPAWLLWAIAVWLMSLARTPFAMVERMQLLPYPDQSLLADGRAWNPPLASLAADWQLSMVPYWLGGLLIAILLTAAIRWQAASENALLIAAGVVGLVLTGQLFPLGDLLCILLVAYLTQHGRRLDDGNGAEGSTGSAAARAPEGLARTELGRYAAALLAFFIAVLVSLEFGLIAILISLLVIAPQAKRLRQSHALWMAIAVPILWCLVVGLPGFIAPEYFAALLRPLSWAWLETPADLLPSMVPIWQSDALHWGYLLLGLPIVARWRQAVIGKLPFSDCLNLGILTWIGVGCTHYFWLVAAAILLSGRSARAADAPVPQFSRRQMQAAGLALGVALLAAALQVATSGATILAADMIRRVVDPTQWNLQGTVLLGDLEQSARWQQPQQRRQYQLLLTNRWDIHHAAYVDYLATLHDWSHWRREAYLRATGQWGGYQARFSVWDPVLVVVDPSELSALHRLSVDSKWKVIGIDHAKVVFASSDAAESKPVIQYAGAMLTTLELPRPGAATDFQRVLALGGPADARQVSGALTALRLPYAALRVLPGDRQPSTRTAAAFAYCELAHRSHRYCGQYSLLDCCRGLADMRLSGSASIVEQTQRYRRTLAAAIRADISTTTAKSGSTGMMDAGSQVRQHLLLGRSVLALEQSEEVADTALRSFYAAIAESVALGPAESTARLKAASENLTGERKDECWFYIGCLAVETGDFLLAREAFSNVSQSPFATMANFYLSQLGA